MSDYRHRKLGAIPSPKDHRDFHVARFVQVERSFPVEFKVAPLIPEPYDQDDVGACVAYSLKAIKEIQEQKKGIRTLVTPLLTSTEPESKNTIGVKG